MEKTDFFTVLSQKKLHLDDVECICVLADFDVKVFCESLFQRYHLEMPASIRHSVTKRKAEFLAGRLAAKLAMLHLDKKIVTIAIGKNREPIFPLGVRGSITHTDRNVASVITKSDKLKGLGIDLERIVSEDMADEISDMVLTPREKKFVYSTGSNSSKSLTSIFSAKEAFFKAAFPQVKRYFEFSALSLVELTQKKLVFEIQESLSPYLQRNMTVEVDYQYFNNDSILTLAKV